MGRFDRKKGVAFRYGDGSIREVQQFDDEGSWICPVSKGEAEGTMGNLKLEFQVAEVKKPLIAVKRISEKGNNVSFGPGKDDNFIENKRTGCRIPMRENGRGSYMIDVVFEDGRDSTITVDSGAEESVCPLDWGDQFPLDKRGPLRNFRSASGGTIRHFGSRQVVLKSPF